MESLIPLIQYVPLWIFLGVSRYYGQIKSGWAIAFQYAGLAAVIVFILTLILLKNRFNRLILGANAFLLFGGISFLTKSNFLLDIMDHLRTSGLTLFVGGVALVCTFVTPTGVFEVKSGGGKERLHSYYFLAANALAFAWSYSNKTDFMLGGFLPFVFLVFVSWALRRL